MLQSLGQSYHTQCPTIPFLPFYLKPSHNFTSLVPTSLLPNLTLYNSTTPSKPQVWQLTIELESGKPTKRISYFAIPCVNSLTSEYWAKCGLTSFQFNYPPLYLGTHALPICTTYYHPSSTLYLRAYCINNSPIILHCNFFLILQNMLNLTVKFFREYSKRSSVVFPSLPAPYQFILRLQGSPFSWVAGATDFVCVEFQTTKTERVDLKNCFGAKHTDAFSSKEMKFVPSYQHLILRPWHIKQMCLDFQKKIW